MKCTNCGYETQPGAKFCVQCGTTMVSATGMQDAPPPPAAAPAPSPSATSVGAAPRPTAAAPSAASLSATMARAAAAAPPVAARPPLGPTPVPLPAADIAPGRKTGLMIALIAVGVAVLVGGFFGYRMLFPDAADSTATQSSPPAMTASPADAKDVSTASPAVPAAADTSSVQQAAVPPPDEARSTASRPSTDKSSPAATATGKTDSASVKADTGKAATSSATPPASAAAGSGAPDAARGVAGTPPAKTAAAVASGSQDRWQQMAEAMARCQREDFFSRVGCQQRVGRKFCEGYWGSVPQCPGGAPRDKAQ